MQPSHLAQLDRLKEMGFGGACIHARTGLDTEYLGPEFMSLVQASLQRAEKNGTYILLYDEDRWPSGFAGGLVTRDPQYRERRLLWTTRADVPGAKLIARYAVNLDGSGCLAGYQCVNQAGKNVWGAWIQIPDPIPWHNNQTYVDTLSRPAIERFIALTHETYRKAVGAEFSKRIPGMFTDEPQFATKNSFKAAQDQSDLTMPFADDFLATYESAYRQKLEDFLPELFWELPEGRTSVARYRYHDHVAERFSRAFAETIGQWCAAHHLPLTGHLMAEDPLSGQSKYVGDAMRSLQHFQIPGIDMLADRLEFLTAKQAQSASRQGGHNQVLSELYGVTGWHFDFAGHKRQGDWQAALGVTLRVPHLAWVSMAGEGKRDYPAAIGWQSPWFKEYSLVEDHFARINTAMKRGTAVVRVGVIHPIESYWLAEGPKSQTQAERTRQDQAADTLCEWLLYGQQDFDFLCEASLPSQASKLRYEVVVVPGLRTIRSTTLDYLDKVGTVVFAGQVPTLVDGLPSDRAQKLAARCRQVEWAAAPLLAALEPVREVRVSPGANVVYQLRQDGANRYLFLCNTDRDNALGELRIAVRGDWDLTQLDTLNGAIHRLASRRAGDWTELAWSMPAHGSLLLALTPGWKPGGFAPAPKPWQETAKLAGQVPITLSEPNVLLLDQAQWRWNDEPWKDREEILRIDDALRKDLKIPLRAGNMAQPWTDQTPPAVLGKLQLKFALRSGVRVESPQLALEEATHAALEFDGTPVTAKPTGWWVDECLATVPLPPIEPGEHSLTVTLPFTRKTNLEWHYLLGDFGVKVTGREAAIVAPVRTLEPGSWVDQGLPFYAGNVTYHFPLAGTGQPLLLRTPDFKAPLLSVAVDGKTAGKIAFAPYELELGALSAGPHQLDVTTYGNRANAFGIVHHVNPNLNWYGPPAWRVRGKDWTYDYTLRPTGILAAPSIHSQPPPQKEAVILHVAPTGNDTWSGRPAAPAPDGKDGPLATFAEAQKRVRDLKAVPGGLTRPVTVLLRGGTYSQPKALVFTPADSGTEQAPVTYAAFPGENPVISGGVPVRGWTVDGKLWRANWSATGKPWRFNQLYVNGQRRPRARIPNARAFLRSDGPVAKDDNRSFYFKPGDLKNWKNPRDIVLVAYHSWETSIHHIESIDSEANRVQLREPAPWPMGQWEKQQRYYVENVFEGLDSPGEWYLDQAAGQLFYQPLPGETPESVEAIAAPLTSILVEFKGDPAKNAFVEHLSFRGLSFQHTGSDLRRIRNPGQGEIFQPGLIQATGLRYASFEGCEIAHSGAHGAWMAGGCSDVRFAQCHLHDLGGGGVYIGGGWGVNEAAATERVTVDNCFIHDGSYLFRGAHGVWIGRSSFNTVTHNEISDFDYSGISCGWSWGFQPTSANHNTLDFNHIHHLGNGDGLSDMGGIYTLGISPGTTERFNHIHDVFNYAHVSHGSGIYTDEGSSDIRIENNVVYRVRECPLFQHYGKDNLIRNNVLAYGGKGQLRRCREDIPCHYVAEGNIVYGYIPNMLGGVWKNGDWKLGRNLYWSTAGAPVFAGLDFAAWQAKGNDAGSRVADPLFENPSQGDFRLKPGSPALALGFQPIDLSKTGLYGNPAWVNLPKKFSNRPLVEIPAPVEPRFVVNFDFESEKPDAPPLEGECLEGDNGAALRVSTQAAAPGGRQSLKFTDAPDQKHGFTPHLYYRTRYTEGPVRLSWDMLNSKETPARFVIEARQYNDGDYTTGPAVAVTPDGTVIASGKELGSIPLGEWARVEIALNLGPSAPGTYQIVLRAPGREPVTAELPWVRKEFREIHWLGVSSSSTDKAAFFLDNLKLGSPDELAQPPKRRPSRPAPTAAAPKPLANAQGVAGCWTFEEDDSWTAADHSGCGNEANVTARWAKGSFGTALLCDPVARGATVKDAPGLNFGTGDFSLELWICPTQLAIDSKDPRRRFLSKDHFPTGGWNVNITADGRPFIEMRDGKTSYGARPKGAIAENAWTHLVIAVDRANAKVLTYYNGALDTTSTIPAELKGPVDAEGVDLSIGCDWQPFIGLLDDLKIHRRALSAGEIAASYAQEKPKRTSTACEVVD